MQPYEREFMQDEVKTKDAIPWKWYLTGVLFSLLKGYAKLAIRICCKKITVNHSEWLQTKGPLLLACNHPNSFLDGLLLTVLFKTTVYSLARGDAFRKPWHGRVLRWLHLLPVYRTSEGAENLEFNYTTFHACKEVFRQGGIVIIFSEGRCVNEWHLRPLRKGTARLATGAWDDGIPLTVLPVGLNYSLFRGIGQHVVINFGQPLDREEVMVHRSDGKMFLTFNDLLRADLEKRVVEIAPSAQKRRKETFLIPVPPWKKTLLAIPALAGFLLHAPLYFTAKVVTHSYFDNDHYDSVLAGLLMLSYPLYLLIVCLLTGFILSGPIAFAALFFFPFSAWSCVQLKPEV